MHSRHLLKVLCSLFFHYVHSIINCDNAYQPVLMVNHREREQIIFIEQVCDFFFIICGNGLNDIGVHDIFHFNFIVTHQKVFDCYHTLKHSFCIHYIAGIYSLFIISMLSDIGKCLFHSHVLF